MHPRTSPLWFLSRLKWYTPPPPQVRSKRDALLEAAAALAAEAAAVEAAMELEPEAKAAQLGQVSPTLAQISCMCRLGAGESINI